MRYNETDSPMELDIFFPEINLALEYQGEYHYNDSKQPSISEKRMEEAPSRGVILYLYLYSFLHMEDLEKKNACEKLNITLIQVPYWWDRKKESLLSTIRNVRPDLIPDSGTFIGVMTRKDMILLFPCNPANKEFYIANNTKTRKNL